MMKFSDIKTVDTKPLKFTSTDWRALEELARTTRNDDFVQADQDDDNPTMSQMQDVMSVVIRAVRDGRISEVLQPATSRMRRRGRKFKHSNPYALVGEVAWQWPRSDALGNGVVLQFATRKMVKPTHLQQFIVQHGGMRLCLDAARESLPTDADQDTDGMGPISRLTISLPEGVDQRALVRAGDDVLVLVKPQLGGSVAQLVTSDRLAKQMVDRLAYGRNR
ncbi:MAG: hypothetical protein K2P94_08500 [Rhodospirillaceae bacterium]|nr:hypothetical protein [Rhodospirillaceae bacterium]